MNMFKKSLLVSAVTFCLVWGMVVLALCDSNSEVSQQNLAVLSPNKDLKKIDLEIVNLLKHRHYLKINFDDHLSQKVLSRYLNDLDPAHSYFFDSDIKEFEEKYRFKLDNALEDGDLRPAFEIFNRYQQRFVEQLSGMINRLETGFGDLNFDRKESLRVDRKDIPWPGSEAAMQELWRKRLKSDVLSLKLADQSVEKIKETLLKRYNNQLNRILQNTSDDVFDFYINSLTLSIDPHTQYFSPHRTENFNINMSLSLEGIGAVLQSEDEFTKILRLIPGGPAEHSKLLKAGDRIVGVAQGLEGEMEDIVGWRLDEVVSKIRGPKGTLVRLQIIPSDAADIHQTKIIHIVRDEVKLEEQAAQKEVIEVERNGKKYKVGIIDIPTFYADFKGMNEGNPDYKSTTKDVQQLLKELEEQGVQGVIIDLRDDGGGSLQEANSLVGLFIGLGPSVQVRNANGRIDIIRDHDPHLVYSGPLVVLVNRMSASASEIFAGAIQDYNRGIILGDQTFGKGTVQSLLPLSKGELKATTAKFYRISGQSTQDKGIVPDLIFPSLYNFEHTGESSLDNALPWDKINSIPYQIYYPLDKIMPALKSAYQQSLKKNPYYFYIKERLEKINEMSNKTEISLSEQTRKKESTEADQWRLVVENRLREAKGEEPFKDIKELEKCEEEKTGMQAAGIDVKNPLLLEAGEVVVDFIELITGNIAHR